MKPFHKGLSAHNSATDEMGKLQQICEEENETLWKQIKRVTNQVSALERERQSSDGNQDGIVNVIRTVLDERIDRLSTSQRNISALTKESFTHRRDTNAVLEAQ